MENTTKEKKMLKKAIEKVNGLEQQLCDAYANFSINHAEQMERESQLRLKRSHREEIVLAKKEVQRIKRDAEMHKELSMF